MVPMGTNEYPAPKKKGGEDENVGSVGGEWRRGGSPDGWRFAWKFLKYKTFALVVNPSFNPTQASIQVIYVVVTLLWMGKCCK